MSEASTSEDESVHAISSSLSGSDAEHLDIIERRENDGDSDDSYDKEAKERHTLEDEIENYHDRRRDDRNSSSSSEEESEDEEGDELTADVDAAVLTTLARIRNKDESIYQVDKKVFEEERFAASKSTFLPKLHRKSQNGQKITLGKYQRERIREMLKSSSDPAFALAEATMNDEQNVRSPHEQEDLTHEMDQENLRKEVTRAFHSMAETQSDDRTSGEENDELFRLKPVKDDDVEAFSGNDKDYQKFLKDVLGQRERDVRDILRVETNETTQNGRDETGKPAMMHRHEDEGKNEDFLVNYVLNRGWMNDPSAAPAPKRKKAESSTADKDKGWTSADESDGSFASRAEAFEQAYNFRFQEIEDGKMDPQVQTYARYIENSLRRKEDKRKRQREERTTRKAKEKAEKQREVDDVHQAKRKDVVNMLKQLKEAAGGDGKALFDEAVLQSDFNPEEYDAMMAEAFDDEYYADQTEEAKPKWDDAASDAYSDEDLPVTKLTKAQKKKLKKREKSKKEKRQQTQRDNDNGPVAAINIDADILRTDYTEQQQQQQQQDFLGLSQAARKRKMEEALDQYYGLGNEDLIAGDQATRFKYAKVPKSSFGLSPVEILLADDRELNKVAGMKVLQPYRHDKGQYQPRNLSRRLTEFRKGFNVEASASTRSSTDTGVAAAANSEVKVRKPGRQERQRKRLAGKRNESDDVATSS